MSIRGTVYTSAIGGSDYNILQQVSTGGIWSNFRAWLLCNTVCAGRRSVGAGFLDQFFEIHTLRVREVTNPIVVGSGIFVIHTSTKGKGTKRSCLSYFARETTSYIGHEADNIYPT